MTFAFDIATSVVNESAGLYSGAVHDGWDIRGNANGGYVMALAASAMRDAAQRRDPISVTAHYLAPLPPGVVNFSTQIIKRGKRFCTVAASINQNGKQAVMALGAFGEIAAKNQGLMHLDLEPPKMPQFEDCVRRSSSGLGFEMGLMNRLDVRLHPDDTGFSSGEPSGNSIVRGWVNFADGRPVDSLALLLIADAFPPPVFHILSIPGWVPTVELTVHVRANPVAGPLRCVFTAHVVQGGMFVEDGQIWDSSGAIVAQSRQIGLVPEQ